jgi:hypothetical protein
VVNQAPGEAIILAPNTYYQELSTTGVISEAVYYGEKDWSPEGYRFCTTRCAELSEARKIQAPPSLSALRTDLRDLQINEEESTNWATIYRIQAELGSTRPRLKRSLEGKMLGSQTASEWITLMITFANKDVMLKVARAATLTTLPFGQKGAMWADFNESWDELESYRRYCVGEDQSLKGLLDQRFGALNLFRRIAENVRIIESGRRRQKGSKTKTPAHIVTETATRIHQFLKSKTSQQEFVPAPEAVRAKVDKMYKYGESLDVFVAQLGNGAILAVPKEDEERFVTSSMIGYEVQLS